MQKTPHVAVVILNYNGLQNNFLPTYLPSVYLSNYINLSIYVVDNGSTDGSVDYLRQEGFVDLDTPLFEGQPPHYLIDLKQNYWFAGGYNRALKWVNADYYVLLNSDVEVDANWIQPIVDLMEADPQIAACQPKVRMVAEPELLEHAGAAGGYLDTYGYPFCRGRLFTTVEKDKGQYNDIQEVFWATGAALFIRPACFHDLGGFDEDFQAHMEEIDLCWRLKRANYKIMVCPASVVWHVGGGTLPQSNPHKTFLNFRNSLSMVYKNEVGNRRAIVILMRLLLDGVAGVRFLLRGEWGNLGAIFKAHWTFFGSYFKQRAKRLKTAEWVKEQAYQGQPTLRAAGRYNHSIVWQYFIKGKQTFKELF